MSEWISRRTFLKASGLAVLSAAAASALAGCGGSGNISPLPSDQVPSMPSENNLAACSNADGIGMGAFSKSFISYASYEADKKRHFYLLAGIAFKGVKEPFTLNTSDFRFEFSNPNISPRGGFSLAQLALNSSRDQYAAVTGKAIPAGDSNLPIWVDLGSIDSIDSSYIGSFTVTYKNDCSFSYSDSSTEPTIRNFNA